MSDMLEIAKKYYEYQQKEIQLAVDAERNRLLAALLSDEVVNVAENIHCCAGNAKDILTAVAEKMRGQT